MPFPNPFGAPFGSPAGSPGAPAPGNIINTWSKGSDGYINGTSQLQIGNTTGNWLFAIAQWDVTEDAGTVVWAADDAHNFWQPVLCTTSTSASVRTAVLLVQNALATPLPGNSAASGLTTVSFSSNGYIRNPIFTVIEVQGLQPGYVLDVTTANSSSSATSLTLSATTTQADFLIAAATSQAAAGPVVTSSAGWIAIGQATTNNADTNFNPVFGASAFLNAAAGAQSITFTNTGNTGSWSGVLIAVSQNGGLPVNPYNTAWPLIQCQAAFGAVPGATNGYYTWTDITPRFLGLKGERGKEFELDQLTASDYTIELDNNDGAFNPSNVSSPYYPNVLLLTPIRLLATWQGRTYQVFSGHIEYLPQGYEDQFGIVQAQCSDEYAGLPQIQLQNCMVQEQVYDNPLHLWPLGEQSGVLFASNISGRAFDTFDQVNGSHGGQTAGFGVSMSGSILQGSLDSVWAASAGTGATNVGTVLRDYQGTFFDLASTTGCFEVWSRIPGGTGFAGQTVFAIEGDTQRTQGQIFGVFAGSPSVAANLVYYDSSGTRQFVVIGSAGALWDGNWHHHFLQASSTGYVYYLDGALVASGSWTLVRTVPKIFEVNGNTSRFSQTPGAFEFGNAQFANVAIYDHVIDPERIVAHFQSGNTGFAGENTGTRAQRLLCYAKWDKPQAVDTGVSPTQALNYMGSGLGYGSGGIAGAFGLFGSFGPQHPNGSLGASGTQADQALQDVSLTENGSTLIDHNGVLMVRSRDTLYDGGVRGLFSDGFVPLNQNGSFGQLNPWTGNNSATVSQGSGTWKFGGPGGSLLITPDGTHSFPGAVSESTIPVTALSSYVMNTWAMSPAGWTAFQMAINWYTSGGAPISSTIGPSYYLPPMTPLAFALPGTAPATAAMAQMVVQFVGTPASSVLLLVSRTFLSATGIAVPYLSDVVINYDVTHLYNDVQVTRNADEAFVRIVDTASRNQYRPRTYTRVIFDNPTNPPLDLIDNANWVLNAYKQPAFRVETMNIDMASNPDSWEMVLRIDVGDVVSFARNAPGATPIVQSFVILKVEPAITQDVASCTYSLGPILNPVLTLDDPLFGLLGPNSLGW
jgi:hypothetical protein